MKGEPAIGEQGQAADSPSKAGQLNHVFNYRPTDSHAAFHSEEEYQAVLRRLDLALGASGIGVWEHSLSDDTVTWDQRMHRLYGTEPTNAPVPVNLWMNALHPDDREQALSDFEHAAERKGSYRSEFRIVLPDGSIRYIRSMANYFLDPTGKAGFIGAEWDVSTDVRLAQALAEQSRLAEERAQALQESQAQIEFAADHDYLTGLPNRRLFDRLCRDLDEGDRQRRLAVVQLDLDRFKEANDAFGHEAGDMVLKAAARAIRSVLGPKDVAARMGGDEFVLVCVDMESEAELRRRGQKLLERIGRGIDFLGKPIASGASIGVAIGEGRPVASLLKDADAALYSAKRSGRGRVAFFTADMKEGPAHRWRASDIRHALETGAIRPFYIPQHDSRTGEMAGLEAVPSWDHPSLGRIGMDEVVPELAEMGLLQIFEQHVLRCVVDDLRLWQMEGFSLPRISLKVSCDGFAAPRLLEEVRRADRLASRLCFELSAADSLRDIAARTLTAATELRSLGAQIAVSGIRDGDGSLIGLLRLRPDRLKLDHSMLAESTGELDQLRVLHAVSEFAHAFGMTIIAEEANCPDQAGLLRTLGCVTLRSHQDRPPLERPAVPLERLSARRDRRC